MGFFKRIFGIEKKESRTEAVVMADGFVGPVYPANDYEKIARESYLQNVIAFRAIYLVATAAAGIPWKLYRQAADPNDAPEELEAGPVYNLLYRPNPRQGWSALIQSLLSYYQINGNAYLERIALQTGALRGTPKELYSLRPDRVHVLKDTRGVTGYEYTTGMRKVTWQINPRTGTCDLLHLRTFNPLDDFYGHAATMSAAGHIDNSNDALTWNRSIFKNGARPGTLVTMERSMTQEQYDRFKEQFNNRYGGVQNIGKTLFIDDLGEGKIGVVPFGWTPKELDFAESSRDDARRIAWAYGVPPQLVGIPGDNTYCLPFESRVATPAGPKMIGDIRAGDIVHSVTTDGTVEKKVLWSACVGEKLVYEVKTKNRTLIATGNHPVLVRISWAGGPRFEYKPVESLLPGDIIITQRRSQTTERDVDISIKELELLGFYLGDGYSVAPVHIAEGKGYKRGGGVYLAIPNTADYGDYYISNAEEIIGRAAKRYNNRTVYFGNTDYVRKIQELGFAGNAHTKRVPEWIYQLPEEKKLAILRGILDSDGSVNKQGRAQFIFCNRELTIDCWQLCLSCGLQVTNVRTRSYIAKLPNGKRINATTHTFLVSRAEDVVRIGTHTPAYRTKIEQNLGKPYRNLKLFSSDGVWHEDFQYSVVQSVIPQQIVPVYDIEVEDNHNFIADGIVVHNSNYKEARESLYVDTIIPLLQYLRDELNNWLFPQGSLEYLDIDIAKIPALEAKRNELWDRAEKSTVLTINERRELMGFPPIEGGNTIFMGAGMVPVLGDDVPDMEEPPGEDLQPEPLTEDEVISDEEEARRLLLDSGYPQEVVDRYIGLSEEWPQ